LSSSLEEEGDDDYNGKSKTDTSMPDLEKAGSSHDSSLDRESSPYLPEGIRVMNREDLLNLGDMQEPPINPEESEETPQAIYSSYSRTMTPVGQPGGLSTTTPRTDGATLGIAMTGVDVRSRKTHEGDKGQLVFIVGFQGPNDPCDPHNWGFWKRFFCTIMIATIGFIVGFASSIDSSALSHAATEFRVSEVVESLSTGKEEQHV
jgi:hypothetical protein